LRVHQIKEIKLKRLLIIALFIIGCDIPTEPEPIHGCLDSKATNYNADASIDNNSCTYPTLTITIDETCSDWFYNVSGNVSAIVGDWATNTFTIAPNGSLEIELPESGSYRIYLSSYNLYDNECNYSSYYWDVTKTVETEYIQNFTCGC